MKKEILFIALMFVLVISPFVSSTITVNSQFDKIYNLGDSISIPVTITSATGADEFRMDLVCGPKLVNFYMTSQPFPANEGVLLMDTSLALTKSRLGDYTGMCKIKATLQGEPSITFPADGFKVSNLIILQPNTEQKEYEPGRSILILGSVVKENGQDASGFINMELTTENSSDNIIQTGTIDNGFYSINITIPEKMRAGNYLIKLSAYEMDSAGRQTNKGFSNYNIAIKQVPTSLEIAFETNKVEPGTNAKIKAILHDQTGDKIASTAIISIKKGTEINAVIQQQSEMATDEYLEYAIAYNEPSANWTVFAVSNQLTAESIFSIIEKENIEVSILNESVIIKNKGNVPYNNSVSVKIGENQTINLNVILNVDESQEYKLKAPDGTYEVEIVDNLGESKAREIVTLTGRAVDIREATSGGIAKFIGIIVLIFIIIVLGFVGFNFIRKGYKRIFFGSGIKKKPHKVNTAWENREIPLSKNSKLKTTNKAVLSSSIKGNQQEVSLVTLKVKNLREIQSSKGGSEETLQKIVDFAEDKKAFIYENQENLFFILTPLKTRTFKNETAALEIAQKAKELLMEQNRLFKQKISFGISMEYGAIVEKLKEGMLEFMSIGNLMINAKRIASIAKEDILIGEKIKEKLPGVRTERDNSERTPVYRIKEIKYHDEEHSRFIKSFLKRAEDKRGQF